MNLIEPIQITEQLWSVETVPFLQVHIVTYNHENFIINCIEGVLLQKTTFPVQLLILDDASTDRTVEILIEYSNKHSNLIKIFLQNENTYGKENINYYRSEFYNSFNGKYIAFCEGDDYWTDPLKLQRQVDFLEKNGNVVLSAENGLTKNFITNKEYLFNKEIEEKYYSAYEMLQSRRFPTASVVFRTEYIKDILKLKYTADTAMWVLLSTKGLVHYNPIVSSVYNRNLNGLVSGTDKLTWAKNTEKWDNQIIKIIKESSSNKSFDYSIFKKRNYREYFNSYTYYNWLKSTKKKYLCFLKCFTMRPIYTIAKITYHSIKKQTH